MIITQFSEIYSPELSILKGKCCFFRDNYFIGAVRNFGQYFNQSFQLQRGNIGHNYSEIISSHFIFNVYRTYIKQLEIIITTITTTNTFHAKGHESLQRIK